MKYKYSQIDKTNLEWFRKDTSKATLLTVAVRRGTIRGLRNVSLDLNYPVTAIAGKNGVGKSTFLALAACAYHNGPDGYNPLGRRTPYYTFSDFFVQGPHEVPPQGISVSYEFLFDNRSNLPPGLGQQRTRKNHGGRWTNYERRVGRNVVFLGIERVVPHSERTVFRSYRRRFQSVPDTSSSELVRKKLSYIMGRKYDRLWYTVHTRYRLPMAQVESNLFSGFNMGAGESAVFNILSTIFQTDDALLLVIDEIELGLHEEAQARLLEQLKRLAAERHIQIICSTHSPRVLECLPPEGRFLLERAGKTTRVLPGITPGFAAGKLSGRHHCELRVLVEDELAAEIVRFALDCDTRNRCDIVPVGSAAAIARYMAHRHKTTMDVETCAVLDGDQRRFIADIARQFLKDLESTSDQQKAKAWFKDRVGFLPSDARPEAWLLSCLTGGAIRRLAREYRTRPGDVKNFVAEASEAEAHSEIRLLAQRLGVAENQVQTNVIQAALAAHPGDGNVILDFVKSLLDR